VQVSETSEQRSEADGVGKYTAAEDWPQGALTVIFAGQVITGLWVSFTVTVKEQVALAPTGNALALVYRV